jgi:hypothetical protein
VVRLNAFRVGGQRRKDRLRGGWVGEAVAVENAEIKPRFVGHAPELLEERRVVVEIVEDHGGHWLERTGERSQVRSLSSH